MFDSSQDVYDRLPISLQNLAVSIYGSYLHWLRYGGRADQHLEQILKSQHFSGDDLRALQVDWLRCLIEHCLEEVPYYQEQFRDLGLAPVDFHSLDDLRRLPVLEKETVRQYPDRFVARSYGKRRLHQWHTSGTTGTPLTILSDKATMRRHYAYLTRLRIWLGMPSDISRVTLTGRVIVPVHQERPPFWRRDLFNDQWFFSSYHISDANLPYYCEKLREIQPMVMSGYPSSIYAVAKYMSEHDVDGVEPKVIRTSAETLMSYQRECIERQFGCRVNDQYGASEMVLFVTQCDRGSYHINSDYSIVEIVDSAGNPVKPGESGEVIGTTLINPVMPLLRYRIGDTAIRGYDDCDCGLAFPTLINIVGRTDDLIVTLDGRRIGRLDPVFKRLRNIKQAQIVQEEIDVVVLRIVPDDGYTLLSENALLSELRKRIGENMTIRVEYVSEIPRGANGKFRAVVSHLSR